VPFVQVRSSKLVQIKARVSPASARRHVSHDPQLGQALEPPQASGHPPSLDGCEHTRPQPGPGTPIRSLTPSACSGSGTCSAGSGTGASSFACFTRRSFRHAIEVLSDLLRGRGQPAEHLRGACCSAPSRRATPTPRCVSRTAGGASPVRLPCPWLAHDGHGSRGLAPCGQFTPQFTTRSPRSGGSIGAGTRQLTSTWSFKFDSTDALEFEMEGPTRFEVPDGECDRAVAVLRRTFRCNREKRSQPGPGTLVT
jgi:hypothetical protein